jgi:hypothetical protein
MVYWHIHQIYSLFGDNSHSVVRGEPKDPIFIPPSSELPESGFEYIHLFFGAKDMSEIDIHSISERDAMKIIKKHK